jgi:hypothetical protein
MRISDRQTVRLSLTLMLIAVLVMLAGSVFAQTKTVTWDAATHYTTGDPLPYGKVWTAVNQYDLGCPPIGPVIAGQARISLPGVEQKAVFEVPAGTCSCFEAVTWVYGDPVERYMSAPVLTEGCNAAASGGCHQGGS